MPTSLWDRLPASATVVSTEGSVTVEEIARLPDELRQFRSQNLALRGSAQFLFKWLSVLDGFANRLIIVPQAADHQLIDFINCSGKVNWLICDNPRGTDAWQGCQIKVDFESEPMPKLMEEQMPVAESRSTDTEWVLATSGTTRTPKLVAHTVDSLTRAMKIEKRFADFRWGLMYDPARFAGLQVLLQSILNVATLLAPPLEAELPLQLEWLADQGCNAISATPTLWRKMMMTKGVEKLSLRQITLGGEIADSSTLSALKKRFPNSRLTHVYASTEAGVGFAVHDGSAGFPADWLETGVRDIRLKIGENGCLWVAPRKIEQRYLGGNEDLSRSDGWIDTGDVLRVADGRVYFCGRLNGSLNIGGNKVFPEEIETAVLEVAGVAAAMARGRSSSVMGNLVEVLVVPDDQATPDLTTRIKAHCRERLDPYKVPAFIRLVEELNVSPAGKLLRNS